MDGFSDGKEFSDGRDGGKNIHESQRDEKHHQISIHGAQFVRAKEFIKFHDLKGRKDVVEFLTFGRL